MVLERLEGRVPFHVVGHDGQNWIRQVAFDVDRVAGRVRKTSDVDAPATGRWRLPATIGKTGDAAN
jgi:hypothetical protein